MTPDLAQALADALLVLHAAVVLFVVAGQALVLLGAWRGWRWVRRRGLRLAHLALMVFIALQTWFGQLCPLTVWEQDLRRAAGQAAHSRGFIEHWLAELLYVEAPWWAFVAAYSGFALLVVTSWFLVPPVPRRARPRTG